MYKHYIKINEANDVIEIFSNMKRPATEDDIFIGDNVERHFTQINGKAIINEDQIYIFKYINGEIVEKKRRMAFIFVIVFFYILPLLIILLCGGDI